MLNINKIIEFTEEEQNHIDNVLLPELKKGKDSWKDQKNETKELKKRWKDFLMNEQNNRCVFCEMSFSRKGYDMEHFVARSIIKEFTYEPKNLFLSCKSCNSRAIKNDKGIIVEPGNSKVYDLNTFCIVHPYLHNPDDHIIFADGEKRIIIDELKCTSLGKSTIDLFDWQSKEAINDRAQAYQSRHYEKEKQELVAEALLYPTTRKTVL